MTHLVKARPMGITQVVSLRDMFPTNTPDEVWMQQLHQEGGWNVLSLDQFKKTQAQRQYLVRHGLTVFVLDPQWARHEFWQMSARFLLWWPEIVRIATRAEKTALRVPWRLSSQRTFKPMG